MTIHHHQPIGQPWLDNHDALRPVDADDALLRRVALPIGLALVAPELRRGPIGNPGGMIHAEKIHGPTLQ